MDLFLKCSAVYASLILYFVDLKNSSVYMHEEDNIIWDLQEKKIPSLKCSAVLCILDSIVSVSLAPVIDTRIS